MALKTDNFWDELPAKPAQLCVQPCLTVLNLSKSGRNILDNMYFYRKQSMRPSVFLGDFHGFLAANAFPYLDVQPFSFIFMC